MEILIIGGTRFLGRHLVDAALERGHIVTLFNRGRSNPGLYPDLEQIRGDRDGDLEKLAGRRGQAVIDTCGYFPRVVAASARYLEDAADQYVYISSVSAYADLEKPGTDESAPVGTIADPEVEEITHESYGPLKALCEQAVRDVYPDNHIVIRPGLIVGPHDPTDRFTYWPWRIAQGGDVLVPDNPDWPVQIIDGRDLAEWTIRMVEDRRMGTYNAVGPEAPISFGQVLETSRAVSGAQVEWVWVSGEFLLSHEVQPWIEMPLWFGLEANEGGFLQVSNQAAVQAGLEFRPLEQIVRDTLEWAASRPEDIEMKAGLTHEREAQLLADWRRASP